MRFTILSLLLCALVATSQAKPANLGLNIGLGGPAFVGFPPNEFFLNVVLQSEAQKLLTQPDFPADLQQRVADTLANAEKGFNDCSTVVATLPWLQIRCVTLQLQKSKNELKAIDDEAKARAAAASTAAPAVGPTA